MNAKELIFKLADGNPGVMHILMRLLMHREYEILKYFERENIHGVAIWESYKNEMGDFDEWLYTLHRILELHYNGDLRC